jgi:hypothetical protein
VKVSPPGERAAGRGEGGRSGDRRAPARPRGEGGAGPARPAEEGRRKRAPERRYVGWADDIERAYCARVVHRFPTAFPVASHPGAATIAPAIVARRPRAILLCIFDHEGPHVWPDGEEVSAAGEEESR